MSLTPLFMPRWRGGCERRAFTLARTLQMQGFAPPPSSPGRSDLMLHAVLPVVLPLNIRGRTVQTV
ncbi:hypothetical protein, partial [Enterobacter hormaechei]